MKKLVFSLTIVVSVFLIFATIMVQAQSNNFVYAEEVYKEKMYNVYLENGEFLFERENVIVGDEYISKNFKRYEVISVNEENLTGVARFVENVKKPNVKFNKRNFLAGKGTNKKIGLYLTHNDESYVPSDGYDSVYGAGGIHDVAKTFKQDLESYGINVVLNETLHIPHDVNAYSRSSNTAKKLLNENNLSALFDVHRDGTARQYYVTTSGGKERCHVRIVVGKANPNREVNETFAIYLMSVAEQIYPWLFKDIYFANGHYNQALFEKSLLFEMGSHMVEKPLVLKSMPALADVVNRALFESVVDDDENITVGGQESGTNTNINDKLTDVANKKRMGAWQTSLIVIAVSGMATGLLLWYVAYKNKNLA